MFLSRRYRPNIWPFYGLVGLEFGLTIGLLVVTGIADPNTYRTRLWQYGADHCWNSSPDAGLYAAANYRPYKTPIVWSQFITNYMLIIVVLSMFFMLVKTPLYIVRFFPPVLSVVLHATMITLYAIGVGFLASPDNSDSKCPSGGAVWYITKSCSVVEEDNLVTYCKQAKATLALAAANLGLFVIYLAIAIFSCFPSKAHEREVLERKQAREARWAELEAEHEAAKAEGRLIGMSPVDEGDMHMQMNMHNLMHALHLDHHHEHHTDDSAHNAPTVPILRSPPVRTHFSSPNAPKSPTSQSQQRFSALADRTNLTIQTDVATQPAVQPIFFPPPPKVASKK